MGIRKNLEAASVKLKSATVKLDGMLGRGKGAHAEWIALVSDVREAYAVVQDAERRAAGVKPDRS